MARMHARRKGKSRSVKPNVSNVDQWLEYSNDEIVSLIVDLAKKDLSASEIGLQLRDQYGIPDVKAITGQTITAILEKNDLKPDLPETFENLLRKALKLRKHLEKNPHDTGNKRGLQLVEAKIKRLVRYYKKREIIAADFYYDVNQIELLLK
ncbi:MAG: 30S ribosomal protein S15 [Candidatus Altiarchaeota archaeon]|nr:30S ribosomal protein S15 [Candidatus Altiarchaeota archaeon]